MAEAFCVCGQRSSKKSFQWEFNVDKNKNASFIHIEEDLQYEDLMKMVSKNFSIKEEGISLSYGISLDLNNIVEDFLPISIGNFRQLRIFISKIRAFDGICRSCVKVITDSASCNKQTTNTFASPVLLNDISVFGSTVQREKQVITDSTSCNKQTTDTFASLVPLNDILVFGSTVQREKQFITDSARCNKQITNTFASHVPLNAILVFGSTVQREKQTLFFEGVSPIPLNAIPDFSHVHIGLSPTTKGAGDVKVNSFWKPILPQ